MALTQLSSTHRPGAGAARQGGRGGRQRASPAAQRHRPAARGPHALVAAVAAEQSTGLGVEFRGAIDSMVQKHKVLLFMKGTKQFPQCGFSNTCVQIFNALNTPYETVNILENELLRSGMKEYSQWPTFPQVYINGEFFGGCDIMIESYQSGELVEVLEAAMAS